MNSTSLTNSLVAEQPAVPTGISSAFRTSTDALLIRTLIPGLLLLALSTSTMALEKADKGPLDQPVFHQTNSPAAARQQLKELRKSVEKERKRLKKLSEKNLKKAAKDGDRVAQLVLAEDYAYEAHNNALTIGAANAAMGDALYWYSLAARRGYPGVPAIDKVMPQFPVRVIKGP